MTNKKTLVAINRIANNLFNLSYIGVIASLCVALYKWEWLPLRVAGVFAIAMYGFNGFSVASVRAINKLRENED